MTVTAVTFRALYLYFIQIECSGSHRKQGIALYFVATVKRLELYQDETIKKYSYKNKNKNKKHCSRPTSLKSADAKILLQSENQEMVRYCTTFPFEPGQGVCKETANPMQMTPSRAFPVSIRTDPHARMKFKAVNLIK